MNKNIFKTWMLMAGFFVFVIFVGFVFAQVFHNPGILYFAVILSLIMNAASYWFSDKIALAVSGAKPADKKQYPAPRLHYKRRQPQRFCHRTQS